MVLFFFKETPSLILDPLDEKQMVPRNRQPLAKEKGGGAERLHGYPACPYPHATWWKGISLRKPQAKNN